MKKNKKVANKKDLVECIFVIFSSPQQNNIKTDF